MEQVLMRDDAPLSPEQWALIDQTVQQVASRILVGRRCLNLYGPVGYGAYTVPLYTYSNKDGDAIRAKLVRQLPMLTLEHDFMVSVRDLELFNQGQPFDTAPVAAAAANCAFAEDRLIFNGNNKEGVEGLLNAKGRLKLPLGDWSVEGQALSDVIAALAQLTAGGYYGPYALIINPLKMALVQRVYGRRGILESDLLKEQAQGGLLVTPVVPENKVVIVSAQPQYLDLAVGQDIVTAFIETANMEHRFRVMETLTLRIKQAGAICTLE